jgi:hypothetical protein
MSIVLWYLFLGLTLVPILLRLVMTIALPFSKRLTTATTIFTCFNVAKNAQAVSTATVIQINALQLQYANLTNLYRQVYQQDVPNQAAVLDTYSTLAQTYILALQTTLNGMAQPNPPAYDKFLLTTMQVIVDNAMQQMANVVAAPDDGE